MRYQLFMLFCLSAFFVSSQSADSTQRKSSVAIYPAIGYTPETTLLFGPIAVVKLKSRDESQSEYDRQSTFTPVAIYTMRNQFLTELNLQYFFKNGNNLNTSPGYFVFPDYYFGIGNNNDPDVSETYLNRYVQVGGQFYIPLNTTVFIGTAFDVNSTRLQGIENGGLLQTDNPLGVAGGLLFGLGPAFKIDSRDNSIYPTKGNLFAIQSLVTKVGAYNYTNALLDLRKYLTLVNDKNIVALQFAMQVTTGKQVPFYRLPRLGGDKQLRGIANASLYRDRQMMYSQAEFRKHLWWRFGGVAFVGAGDVMSDWSSFDLSELKYVGGVGLRFQVLPDERINLRMDLGFSQGGQSGFYVGMQEAF
jgi:outer membrane protein assembly factor BamA